MKKYLLFLVCLILANYLLAQEKKFNYKFYGQVRTDLFYNSRSNEEAVDGIFYLYPKDRLLDPNGDDLNATSNGSFAALFTRLGLDVTGPQINGKIKTSAKIEIDFHGSANSYTIARIRHAYFNLNWNNSNLLVGQTWHPLFGDVAPHILNQSVGAPYQPFSRSPQIKYQYTYKSLRFTGAAIWQAQFMSQGPNGKSLEYLKFSKIPELYVGADYIKNNFQAGVGIEMLSMTPRTQGMVGSKIYKVNERLTTLSYEAHAQYTKNNWYIGAKSVLGSNLTQTCMLGGFGVKSVDSVTGEKEYTPIRVSSSWLNIEYGKTWKPALFFGYSKNLGTPDALATSELYGTGVTIDRTSTIGAELSYNISHWKFGIEYFYSTAAYGSVNMNNGKVTDTHTVSNHRILGAASFSF